MTKKILMALLFIVGCSTMFVSCSDNEETISQSKATFARSEERRVGKEC